MGDTNKGTQLLIYAKSADVICYGSVMISMWSLVCIKINTLTFDYNTLRLKLITFSDNTKKHQNDSAGNATFGIIVIVVRILLFFGIGVLFQRCFGFCCCMCNRNNRPDSSKVHTTPHMDTWLGSVVTSSNVRTADKDPLPSYDSVFPSK